MSYLVSNKRSDFNEIKSVTKATAGNLSVQLKKLETAGYLKIKKGFLNNYPHTSLEITNAGLDAFDEYVNAIKSYINLNDNTL